MTESRPSDGYIRSAYGTFYFRDINGVLRFGKLSIAAGLYLHYN